MTGVSRRQNSARPRITKTKRQEASAANGCTSRAEKIAKINMELKTIHNIK